MNCLCNLVAILTFSDLFVVEITLIKNILLNLPLSGISLAMRMKYILLELFFLT